MVKKAILNAANILSFTRMFLAPIFPIAVFNGHYLLGFIVLFIAILTDFLDGHIARIWNLQTRLGKMLDPLADKVIIFFALLTLMITFDFPLWVGLLVICRDLILFSASAVFLFKNKKKTLNPNLLGKITTFVQMSTVIIYLLNVDMIIKNMAIGLMVIMTILSSLVYFKKGHLLFDTKRSSINLPNKITIGRMLLIPVFIALLLSSLAYKEVIAAGMFVLLALSDALDGYLARTRNEITNFGKLIDPLADKLLVSSALIFLIGNGVDAWMAFIIIAREFAVTGLRTVALSKNVTLAAKTSGKLKTVLQVVGIVAVLLAIPGAYWIMVGAVLITLYSGIEYFWKGRMLFKELG